MSIVSRQNSNVFTRFWHEFNYVDTSYVEPNHYNWEAMLQTTTSFEWLYLSSQRSGNHSLSLSPDPLVSVGPYLGWRWIFLGYKFALNDHGPVKSKRTEFEISLYGSMLCCDLIYRKTGDDFKWREYDATTPAQDGQYIGGVSLKTIGANVYYVFNHRRFSLPSLFAQSTVQKRSQGSWMLGASVTKHDYDFDMRQWPNDITIFDDNNDVASFKYMNYAISAGYGYNWVLRKNLMLGISLMPAIGYKHITGNTINQQDDEYDFTRWISNNFNIDITGRAALVWNNNKYYAGLSLIVHNYNFSREKFSIHNTFGTINVYVGLNFKKRANNTPITN